MIIKSEGIPGNLKPYIPLVEGIANTFGSYCEVVLHDVKKLQNSIIAISNGHVTGRDVGGPPTDYLVELINKEPEQSNSQNRFYSYKTRSKDGKDLKSTTILIRNNNNEVIGALCINIDLTSPQMALNFLEKFVHIHEDKEKENFPDNTGDFLRIMIDKSLSNFDKPVHLLTKEDKLQIIRYLNQHKIFQIKGSVDVLAKELNVSRYTVYNYLEEVAAENEI